MVLGKSTLLKAIIDSSMLSEGVGNQNFSIYKEGCNSIGYLKQMEFDDTEVTMIDEILKVYKPQTDLEKKMKKLLEQMQTDKSEKLAYEYSKAMDRYEFLDGYTYKKEYETAIKSFGFTKEDKQKKIAEFSGGQRAKIAFIKLLLSKPDILLLDEPTNHLDVTTIEWLEQYLKNYPRAIVIVSHDRMFLDKIVNKVYEIEYGQTAEYSGNYAAFELQKKQNYEKQLKDYEYQQKELKRLNDIVIRFKYKPTKARMAMSKLKQIERMVKVESPNRYDLTTFKTNFVIKKQSGKDIVYAKNLEIGYDGKALQNLTFNVYRSHKIGIIGANGIGKSTLLKTIVGRIPKISGELELGYNVEIGYFDQQMALLDSDKTVMEDFSEEFPALMTTECRNSLAAFMFYGDDVFKKISMLSGGEKVRLQLCKILKKGPNVLVLDEPTNHMDIIGKESLEQLLSAYTGTILVVSHDRFFINKIADSLIIFEKNGVRYFDGTYEEYEKSKALIDAEQMSEKALGENLNNTSGNLSSKNITNNIYQSLGANINNLSDEFESKISNTNINFTNQMHDANKTYGEEKSKQQKAKESYFEQKERNKMQTRVKKLERDIESYESEILKINEELMQEEIFSNYEILTEKQALLDELNEKLEMAMSEWEELLTKLE